MHVYYLGSACALIALVGKLWVFRTYPHDHPYELWPLRTYLTKKTCSTHELQYVIRDLQGTLSIHDNSLRPSDAYMS